MSAKMKRRRRHDRLKRVRVERRENLLFFGRGEFPASALAASQCSCGARAFSRVSGADLDGFHDAHSYCWEQVSYE